MQPTLTDVTVDPVLTKLSIKIDNEMEDRFMSEWIFPQVQVDAKTGFYFVYDSSNLRVDNSEWGPTSRANRVGYDVTQTAYGPLQKNGLEIDIPNDLLEQAKTPLDPKLDATKTITEKMWLAKESALSTFLANTANVTQNTTLTTTDQWSDFTNSTPFEDVQAGLDTILAASGRMANKIFMGWEVFAKLRNHPDLIERMKFDGSAKQALSEQQMADAFGVPEIRVGAAIVDSADEGASADQGFVWGKHCWLEYTPASPSLRTASAGYHLQLGAARTIDTWDEPQVDSSFVRIRDYFESKLTSTAAIYLIKDAVA